jgi:hypothetical protein
MGQSARRTVVLLGGDAVKVVDVVTRINSPRSGFSTYVEAGEVFG